MAYGILFLSAHLRESAVVTRRHEHRIISESVVARRGLGYTPLDYSVHNHGLTACNECYDRTEPRLAVILAFKFASSFAIFALESCPGPA